MQVYAFDILSFFLFFGVDPFELPLSTFYLFKPLPPRPVPAGLTSVGGIKAISSLEFIGIKMSFVCGIGGTFDVRGRRYASINDGAT